MKRIKIPNFRQGKHPNETSLHGTMNITGLKNIDKESRAGGGNETGRLGDAFVSTQNVTSPRVKVKIQ